MKSYGAIATFGPGKKIYRSRIAINIAWSLTLDVALRMDEAGNWKMSDSNEDAQFTCNDCDNYLRFYNFTYLLYFN